MRIRAAAVSFTRDSARQDENTKDGVLPGQRAQTIVQAVNNSVQGVASDLIIFEVPLNASAKTSRAEPLSLPVNEEAMATAVGDGTKTRASGNRLPALT